jgi:nucleoside 2-deoxyribosyltransferase
MSQVSQLCHRLDLVPLLPGTDILVDPQEIFQQNLTLIQSADGIVANLNPFRGFEPDSGTIFEVGYGYALGKFIVGYVDDQRDVLTKLADHRRLAALLTDDSMAEDFGLPLNLMPNLALNSLAQNLTAALMTFREKFKKKP